jgi:ATP-dependent DNA helicase RecQ
MIDYIPPFRGRAVHLIDRKKRFEELTIDFEELQRRKKAEYDKLERVIKFATTNRCRQLEILEYFGDADRKRCRNCDNCQSRPQPEIGTAKFSNSDACLYAAQVALSGAARTHGRIGKTLIAQMLSGSESKKLKQLGLNRLSTFGLLKKLRQTDVANLLEFLIEQGYLQQIETTKFRPLVQISRSGTSLMATEQRVDLTNLMPSQLVEQISFKLKGKKPHLSQPANNHDVDHSNSPTSILSDAHADDDDREIDEKTIRESNDSDIDSTTVKNRTVSNDLNDESIREVLNEGPRFKNGLHSESPKKQHSNAQQTNIAAIDRPHRDDLPAADSLKPTYYWTWRLLADGYSVSHIEQVRQIDRATIFSHAQSALENGLLTQPQWLMSKITLLKINNVLAANPDQRVPQLLSQLPPGVSNHELIYCVKFRNTKSV